MDQPSTNPFHDLVKSIGEGGVWAAVTGAVVWIVKSRFRSRAAQDREEVKQRTTMEQTLIGGVDQLNERYEKELDKQEGRYSKFISGLEARLRIVEEECARWRAEAVRCASENIELRRECMDLKRRVQDLEDKE